MVMQLSKRVKGKKLQIKSEKALTRYHKTELKPLKSQFKRHIKPCVRHEI